MEGGIIEVAFELGFGEGLILAVLFGTSVGVLAVGLFFLTQDLKEANKEIAIRFAGNGRKVVVRRLPPSHFHIFLSHSQEYGADQVGSIKYILERLVGNISCFLDVDTLRDHNTKASVNELPTHVKNSQTLCLFLTKQVFERSGLCSV